MGYLMSREKTIAALKDIKSLIKNMSDDDFERIVKDLKPPSEISAALEFMIMESQKSKVLIKK